MPPTTMRGDDVNSEAKSISRASDDATESIACAAVMHEDTGLVFSLPRPARHHNILHAMKECGHDTTHGANEQGFLTNDGRFVWRERAKQIAQAARQILPRSAESDYQRRELYSEDLW